MGILNLLRILKQISTKRSLNSYKGKKAGIDGYTWLHRSLYCIGEGILKNPVDITKCINYFTKKLQLLLRNEITPIFIFDGDKLPMKTSEEDKRQIKRKEYEKEAENMLRMNNVYGAIYKKIEAFDVTPEFAYEFMKILKIYNVEYYVAPYEADAQLAYLSHINYIDFIITEDSDLLAYGCKCVLYKLGTLKNEPIDVGEEILWDNIKNSKEIRFKNFSKDKFLSFCILCGCDYLKISGVGPKLSNEALNKFDDYNKFLGYIFNKSCTQGSIIDTIKKYEKTFLTFRYQVVYCPKEKRMKYFNDIKNDHNYSFLDKYKNDLSFLGVLDFDNIDKYVKGEINPITKKEINENNERFYNSTNIYDISSVKYNNQRTMEDDLFVKDDQSEDSGSAYGKNKFISQNNFFSKIGKYKGGKKQKKLEKPKNQTGIEYFFVNNNKKDIKKAKKSNKKINTSISKNNEEEMNKDNNGNDENKINIFDSYCFNIDNIENIDNKRTFNDLDLFKDKKLNNYTKANSNPGLHLSNKELNSCYNPLTQFRKKNKTSKNKIISTQVSNSIINSKQKKIYSKFSLKFKDEDDENKIVNEEVKNKINKNKNTIDINLLDNYCFSENNTNNAKNKDEYTFTSPSGELSKTNEFKTQNLFEIIPEKHKEPLNGKSLRRTRNTKEKEYIKIEDDKEEIKIEEDKETIKIENKKAIKIEDDKEEIKIEDDEEIIKIEDEKDEKEELKFDNNKKNKKKEKKIVDTKEEIIQTENKKDYREVKEYKNKEEKKDNEDSDKNSLNFDMYKNTVFTLDKF